MAKKQNVVANVVDTLVIEAEVETVAEAEVETVVDNGAVDDVVAGAEVETVADDGVAEDDKAEDDKVEDDVTEDVKPAEEKTNKRVRLYYAGENVAYEAKMPLQLKQIVDFLVTERFKGTGTQIIQAMIDANKIITRQNPAVLFAFYARRLENMGIVRG